MDLQTVMMMMAVGSLLFWLLLVVLRFNNNNPQKVPFWITAKLLQTVGSFMLAYRTSSFNGLTLLANISLLLGCAYEAWVIRIITGRPVKRMQHIGASVVIILAFLTINFLIEPHQVGLILLFQSALYFLPSVFLFGKSALNFTLRLILGICYGITGLVFFSSAVVCFVAPEEALHLYHTAIFGIIPGVSFCIFLLSGFILLMLAKERSDLQIREMEKSLRESEIRFQRIVETAIEGILTFDEHYQITFANKNMASILGYTVEEMIGRSYISFFPKDQLDVYIQQEALRKNGKDSVYECCLFRKDGGRHWFLVSAKAVLDEKGKFEGSFAMLTDINERKEMELLLEESNRRLTELSNKDSLTGIANRRRLDTALEFEFLKLKHTNSELSIILLDIDHFKRYNDYYGHVMGDECLRQIGEALRSCLRMPHDLAARYGGEEFICILPDTDIDSAVKIAERIRQRIMDLKIEHKESDVSEFVTASFGVTTVTYSPVITPEEIISKADELLYRAKVSGRNRVEFAEL